MKTFKYSDPSNTLTIDTVGNPVWRPKPHSMSPIAYWFILINIALIITACLIFEMSPGLYMLHIIGNALAIYSSILGGIASIFAIHYLITG